MKRSRRVMLTLMGSAAAGAVSMGFVNRERPCGSGLEAVPGIGGKPYCRPSHGGFGGTLHRMHGGHPGQGHGGHGHGGG
ncbi:hypothetical protein XH98_22170 [Bradyrhizobium sp. CCBAU 51745]|uniref:hypothetical protein n=1 Tax=Bradyrhizobium sp. CCBAU 51745 TaxID=1325099 RepID=UPI002305C615|nr:hypothetical protein [Bradyrhizobium sp. CCBAU 51745]MDA9441740.1 hypothetical protein [Bradyrhizobium sp. CCBAU 51745]